jgi:tetratricopeptide (TPR) repeat protein
MASKVNKRFVVILVAGVLATFIAVAGVFVFIRARSGTWNVSRGEAAVAKGDYDKADSFYSRAVSKDPTNVAWLKRWREIREKRTPENQVKYRDDYTMLVNIYKSIAVAERTNIEAHKELLETHYQQALDYGNIREAWSGLADEADGCIRFFTPDEPLPLRRYRALANSALSQIDAKTDAAVRDQAQKDLEEVLKENPKDVTAGRSLAQLHVSKSDAARATGDAAKEKQERTAAQDTIAQLVATSPDDPEANLSALYITLSNSDREADKVSNVVDQQKARQQKRESLRPALEATRAQIAKADPSLIKSGTIAMFLAIAQAINPDEAYSMTQSILDRALAGSPNSSLLLMIRAQTLEAQGKLDDALATYEKVAALPNLPLSWDGMRLWEIRRRAIFAQANVATSQAIKTDATEAMLVKAKDLRQKLAQNVPEDSTMLALIDAKIALAEKKIDRVELLLAKIVASPGEVADQLPQALLLLADASLRLNKPGTAEQLLVQFDKLRPGSTPIRLRLAQIYAQNQQYNDAALWLRRVLDADPKNDEAKTLLATISVLNGAENADAIKDPIVRVLAQSERLDRGTSTAVGDTAAAAAVIEPQLQPSKYDPRLVERLAGYRLRLNQIDQAIAVLNKGVEAHPDNTRLKDLARTVSAPQNLESTLKLIQDTDGPEWKKLLNSGRAYAMYGKQEDADRSIAAALAKAPEEPEVILVAFERAIARKDMGEAERLAGVAAKVNADGAQGDALAARVALVKGNPAQASDILQKAVARGTATSPVLRTLGIVQLQLGKFPEAIKSIQQALDMNPADVLTIRTLIEAYAATDRPDDALALARKSEPIGRSDPDFVELWLSLEAQNGTLATARTRREQMLKQNPGDMRNTAALAELYIRERKFDDSKKLIDTLKEKAPGLSTTALEARWNADQAQMGPAVQTYLAYINTLQKKKAPADAKPADPAKPDAGAEKTAPQPDQPDPALCDAYLSLGQFLTEHNDATMGLQAMQEAVRFQDPKTRVVERAVADEQLRRGAFEGAEKTYQSLLDSGIDDSKNEVHKRLVEALVQQEKFAEAEKQIASIKDADRDVELLLLRSNVARGMGDEARARKILDSAVAAFPSEPLPYVRRARMLMIDDSSTRDALDDLDAALRLRPGMWQALRTRAGIYQRTGKQSDALKDTIAAMEGNPSIDGLRFETIRALLAAGQESQAITVAEDGLKSRPTNLNYIKNLGDVFAQAGNWPRAARFYKEIWLQAPEAGATIYTTALLSSSPPNFTEAEAMLKSIPKIESNPNMLMVRAAIRKKQNKTDDASGDIRVSLSSVTGQDRRATEVWYQRFRSIIPEPATALQTIKDFKGGPGLDPFLRLWRGRIMVEDAKTRDDGVALLQTLAKESSDSYIKSECQRSIMSAYTVQEKWAEAADACRAGIALLPNDTWFMNNLAFILSDHLGKGQDAIDLAERAVKAAPQDWNMLDTLATTYWATGQKDKAIAVITRATRFTNSDVDRARCVLKGGKWKLEMGDRSGAVVAGQTLRTLVVDEPIVGKTLGKDIDSYCKDAGVR